MLTVAVCGRYEASAGRLVRRSVRSPPKGQVARCHRRNGCRSKPPLHSTRHAHLRVSVPRLRPHVRHRSVDERTSSSRSARAAEASCARSSRRRRSLQGFGLLRDRPRQEVEAGGRDDRAKDAAASGSPTAQSDAKKDAEGPSKPKKNVGRRRGRPAYSGLEHRSRVRRARKAARSEGEEGRMTTAEIGVFGGSGFYSFLESTETVDVDTPYGKPSAPPVIGEVGGRAVAFIPRHGLKHEFPPHRVPYRANVWAMKELGVTPRARTERLRLAPADREARRLRDLRPARRPHERPAEHVLRRPESPRTSRSPIRTAPRCADVAIAQGRCAGHPAPRPRHRRRDRGPALLHARRSRSGSRRRAGRSST